MDFIRIEGRDLVDGGRAVCPRGANLGNWLIIEHFMIGLPSVERDMHRAMADVFGRETSAEFWRRYRDAYITEADIAYLGQLGATLVRLPFNQTLLEDDAAPGAWRPEGLARLDACIGWCRSHGIRVLLDLHAAPGAQALDWNADCDTGRTLFWEHPALRARATAMWRMLAERYRDEPAVFGYDLLNEPVARGEDGVLNGWYHETMAAIRAVDPRHIICLESNMWSKEPARLDPRLFTDPQVMAQAHLYLQQYLPWDRLGSWPTSIEGRAMDRSCIVRALDAQVDAVRFPRPWLMGEFGLHHGGPDSPMGMGETLDAHYAAYAELIDIMRERGMPWTIWTYKDAGMGWVRPTGDRPWLQFACRERFSKQRAALRRLCGVHDWSELGERPELYHRLAELAPGLHSGEILARVREVERLGEGLLLRSQLLALKRELGDDALLAMAEDWRFDRCQRLPAGEKLVRAGLAT